MPKYIITYRLINNDQRMRDIVNETINEHIIAENIKKVKIYAEYELFFLQIGTYMEYNEFHDEYNTNSDQMYDVYKLKKNIDILNKTCHDDLVKLKSEDFKCFPDYLKLLDNIDDMNKDIVNSNDYDYSTWSYYITAEKDIEYTNIPEIDHCSLVEKIDIIKAMNEKLPIKSAKPIN